MSVGLRVVRGPDLGQGDKDGGEGHVGSVVVINQDNTCDVVWDNGRQTTCSIGKGEKKEIRIVDNAPAGVKHLGVICDVCKQRNILGIRWKCCQCNDYDLCSICYFSDKHELTHQFNRITRQSSKPVTVPKRSISQKMRLLGIFPGAVVVRGRDWSFGTQDGGSGSEGKVMEIRNYGGDTGARNAVKVKWNNGEVNVYKIGACGKVDLKFIEPGVGMDYYRDHLPVPDTSSNLLRERTNIDLVRDKTKLEGNESSFVDDEEEEEEGRGIDTVIKIGDRVCVFLPLDELRQLQRGRGGWSMRMADCIGQIGKVKGIESDEILEVEYDGCTWQFYKGAVRKVYDISSGDTVRVLSEAKTVELLQKGHGGWDDEMAKACGKVGKVEKIDSDGDVVVQFGQQVWVYSPACLLPAPGQKVDMIAGGRLDFSSSMRGSRGGSDDPREQLADNLARFVAGLLVLGQQQHRSAGPEHMIQACARGDTSAVAQLIKMKKDLVNCSFKDLTPLMIASHEGHLEIIQLLLSNGANINTKNDDDITAVKLAAAGKKENIAMFLISKGADVTDVDNNKRSMAHHASYNEMFDLLKAALEKGCNPNLQDVEGDTALHDAIAKSSDKAVNILLGCPNINLTLANKRGFPPLLFAALKDHAFAVEKILSKNPGLIKKLMPDGKSGLHIAAINDHREVASLFMLKGKVDVNLKDDVGIAALHLACKEAYHEMAKLLITNGADTNIQDSQGNTPLHLTLACIPSKATLPGLLGLMMMSQTNDDNDRFKTACVLVENNGDIDKRNNRRQTPLQVCNSPKVKNAMENFLRQRQPQRTQRGAIGDPLLDLLSALLVSPCGLCKEEVANAKFVPCGHKVVCEKCSLGFDVCPECRTPVQARLDNQGRRIVLQDPCKVQ